MSLLQLKGIGKIYVSENNVNVGIRGINLEFNRGEFVAITGKSGSGKSTLLNVISGMDTYEEGELIIDGNTTSHYTQSEWEDYRQKYISFIFQDYNIIDSFTVLQNVELALMDTYDPIERKKKAVELIERVGLTKFMHHKGSKLSGGQKQRTVIARALAKNSPIILADEPTGNLDSETSKEIIELLNEVSKDKLLIVVTHNFEQVEGYATRHIRIFDGNVESDQTIKDVETVLETNVEKKEKKNHDIANGLLLGRIIFTSKIKLTIFICLLLLIGTIGIFGVTAVSGDAAELFKKSYMFNHIDGRVVLIREDGAPLTDVELNNIKSETKAQSVLHYDYLLDATTTFELETCNYEWIYFRPTYNENFGNNVIGRYPEKENEVLMYLPISCQNTFGKDELDVEMITIGNINYNVVGIKYFYDNSLEAKALFTNDGYDTFSKIYYLFHDNDIQCKLNLECTSTEKDNTFTFSSIVSSFEVDNNKIYLDSKEYNNYKKSVTNLSNKAILEINYKSYVNGEESKKENLVFDNSYFTDNKVDFNNNGYNYYYEDIYTAIISVNLLKEIANKVIEENYRQASLFYNSDKKAEAVSIKINENTYIAVPSNTTYEQDPLETITNTVAYVFSLLLWGFAILFLSFFINLCSSKAVATLKSDMAIMRSMGIRVKTIKLSIYVRMFISLIPAYIITIVLAIILYSLPKTNGLFYYLHTTEYILLVAGTLLLAYRVSCKHIKKLFSVSVKSALKGGN